MPATFRLIASGLAGAGILFASIGMFLAVTWAYPDIQCSGDACLITQNVFTIPAMLVGMGLGIAAAILFLWPQLGSASPRSIK